MLSSFSHNIRHKIGILALAMIFAFGATQPVFASLAEDIAAKNKQIEELQRQIADYQNQIDQNRSTARTLESEIAKLNTIINQVTLEVKSLGFSIDQTSLEIRQAIEGITDAEQKLEDHKEALGQYIRIAYETDQKTLTEILLNNGTLSDFFNDLNNLKSTQDNLRITINNIQALRTALDQEKENLENKKSELEHTRSLQEIQRRSLDGNKAQVNKILRDTKGQESKFQELVKKSQRDIEAIRSQISYLLQGGISAEDAVKYAQLAAIRAGIRPAFLLAELEQESALGANVGKCLIVDDKSGYTKHVSNGRVYTKGIHPTRDLGLFLKVTAELGKDPYQTPVSCGQGWGGAMGPAQFIPSTWMGYRDRVSDITGHRPADPWNFEDAFTAAATKLANDGADSQTRAGEVAASKRYYCGNAKSTSAGCINYANSVQRLAEQIEQNL